MLHLFIHTYELESLISHSFISFVDTQITYQKGGVIMLVNFRSIKKAYVSFCLLFFVLFLVGCQETTHSVTIIMSDNSEQTFLVKQGNVLVEPEINEQEGFVFDGWFYQNEPFDFSQPIEEDMTIIGKWTALEYLLEIKDYRNNIILSDYYSFGETIPALPEILPMFGYTFNRWTYNLSTMPSRDLVIKPLYEPILDFDQHFEFKKSIVKVETNDYSYAVLFEDGTLMMWGRNEIPGTLCGPYEGASDTLVPRDVTSGFDLNEGERIIDVILGGSHNYVLTSNGRRFHWGGCNHGNLSFMDEPEKKPVDVSNEFIIPNEVITHIYNFEDDFIAITDQNHIYTKGRINSYEFGLTYDDEDDWIDHTNQFPLNDNEVIVKAFMARGFDAVLTNQNRVFMFGNNKDGQLGIPKSDDIVFNDIELPFDLTPSLNLAVDEQIIDIELGVYHTLVLTNLGRVIGFGANIYGQLGLGTEIKESLPTDLTGLMSLDVNEEIIDIMVSDNNYSLILTNQDRLIGFGFNKGHVLSSGDEVKIYEPVVISDRFNLEGRVIQSVIIGYYNVALVHEESITILGNKTFDLIAG